MNKCSKESEDEQTNRGKNEEDDGFAFVPDDILLEILKRLPDAFLRYKAKYVCKRWFMISTNRILLDHAFILQHQRNFYSEFETLLVDIGEAQQGLEVREQNIRCSGKIKSWYNEFLLISIHGRRYPVYVFNSITKESLYLPRGEKIYCFEHYKDSCYMSLFFDGFKGVYKVVHLFIDCTASIQCHILILGRDIDIVSGFSSSKWKRIEIASDMKKWECQYGTNLQASVQVQGRYFHWDVRDYKYLMSMDMVKEEIFQTSLPGSDDRMGNLYSIVEMGGYLTLIDGGGVPSSKADIWILKDFQRIKWDKLHSITVPDYFVGRFLGTPLNRVCGVISERYIIFMQSKPGYGMFSYDMKTGVLKELNIRIKSCGHRFIYQLAPCMFSVVC